MNNLEWNKDGSVSMSMNQEITCQVANQWDVDLIDLLCLIHRDGGHYVSEHGMTKAIEDAKTKIVEQLQSDDYRSMYLKVRDELAALQQSRAPLTSKEIRAIEVDVATNLSLDYPSPAEQFTRAIEARHGIK